MSGVGGAVLGYGLGWVWVILVLIGTYVKIQDWRGVKDWYRWPDWVVLPLTVLTLTVLLSFIVAAGYLTVWVVEYAR